MVMPAKQPNVVTWTAVACPRAGFWNTTPAAKQTAATTHSATPRTGARPSPEPGVPDSETLTTMIPASEAAIPAPSRHVNPSRSSQPAEQRDQDRPDGDDQRGGARVHLTLAPVERDHVEAEPQHAGPEDAGPGRPR